MEISYDVLKSFVVFCKSKNIYEAAKAIGISQPAMSQRLKTLEEYFDKPVFSIQGKRKVLTSFGKSLLEKLSEQFSSIDKALEETIKSTKDFTCLTMRIGARPGAIFSLVDHIIFPGNIQYSNMGGSDSVKAIVNGDADFCFSRAVPDSLNIIAKKIVEIDNHFIIHKSLLRNEDIKQLRDHKFLENAPFYTYSEEIPYMVDWCKSTSFEQNKLNVKGILSDWKTIIKIVIKNKGYTLCPSGFKPSDPNLIIIPVSKKDVTPLTLYLLYSKQTKELFPVNKCFDIDGIKDSLINFQGYD